MLSNERHSKHISCVFMCTKYTASVMSIYCKCENSFLLYILFLINHAQSSKPASSIQKFLKIFVASPFQDEDRL